MVLGSHYPSQSMSSLDQAAADVVARPRLDGARRRYADASRAIDPARAELIDVQLAAAALQRASAQPRRFEALTARASELLAAHQSRWLTGSSLAAAQPRWSRGFVEQLSMTPTAFLAQAPALFATAPLLGLELTTADGFAELCASPWLTRLAWLDAFDQPVGDAGAIALADSPGAGTLVWLDLGHAGVGRAGIEALAGSSGLGGLRYVNLAGNPGGDPTDRIAGQDGDHLAAFETRPLGRELEARFGPIGWLHWQPNDAAWYPPRPEGLVALEE